MSFQYHKSYLLPVLHFMFCPVFFQIYQYKTHANVNFISHKTLTFNSFDRKKHASNAFHVSDINDPVTLSNLPISLAVAENTAVGTSLFTVSFNDVDTSQAHTISMTSTPTSGLNYFTINTTSK